MTRDELYALIADHVTVTDEWGGEKIANWRYGYNLCVAGIDEATDAILAKLESEQKATDKANELMIQMIGKEEMYWYTHRELEA